MTNRLQNNKNVKDTKYILMGNGGDGTIALLQWALETDLTSFCFVSIDTGFAHHAWEQRIQHIHAWLEEKQISFCRLSAKAFPEWIQARASFPSIQFPWCASVLKGLPYNDFFDEIDPFNHTTIVMAKTKFDARSSSDLPEYIEASAYFGDRRVWHPLYNTDIKNFQRLIHATGFKLLGHRSLECEPCIYNTTSDFARLHTKEVQRLRALEAELQQTMFTQPVHAMQVAAASAVLPEIKVEHYLNQFDGGCGMPYGCGL